jgi:hypothetical protein
MPCSVGHAGRMLLSSAICRLLCLLLCAQGLCNMSLQPGRYSLVSLTDLTSQQMHRCLLVCLESRAGHASPMQLSAAICRLLCCCSMHRVCATCQHRRLQAARSASIQHIKTIVLGNSSVLLSSYCADAAVYGLFCSEYCCMHRVCASRKSDRY